ncbi:MAG: redox-sensing transcriptional repressor Rex [bacterium]
MTPEKTVARLSLYRRFLKLMRDEGAHSVYSHQLADMVRITPAQVRRDLMVIGYSGNPQKGYDVNLLIKHIDDFFNVSESVNVVVVGIGNVGRAMLSYFRNGKSHINVIAGFDTDPNKVDRVINNCPCYHLEQLPEIVKQNNIKTGILTVPATEAQNIANIMVESGIKGLLNFAPTRLKLSSDIFIEDVDITMHLEKVAYFSSGKQKKIGGKNV